ncbi:MAG: substrate-binding domain-containing protein [Actinomycetota bacterium]|nr:substrate-binding domain-containing protein [Actinomycetota bacterium]
MLRSKRALSALAVVSVVTLGGTACSSQGGRQAEAPAPQAAAAGNAANTPRKTVAMITHEAPGDTFWDKIRNGAQAAAAKDNIQLDYAADPEAARQATLIQNAVDRNVDGIAVTMSKPDPLAPAIKAAIDKGIPVVGFNSGINEWKRLGADMYFGSDEALAGETAGKRIADSGGQKVLCVIQEQGSVALEARCDGVKKGLSNTEILNVTGTDLPSVQSTIQAKLSQDKAVTHIVTLGAPYALVALQSREAAGSQAKVVTFDLNADAAKAIQDGRIDFSIDQQPYVQGHEAVDALWLNLTNGNDIGGGLPVLTGPSFVDKSNIEQIVQYASKNTR